MSVTPELIKSKLSSVDQSSDTIVSVSSWLLFHKRSAQAIVDVWLQAVRDGSSNRKLSLIYLANEVSQQSRAKKRPEYLMAFSKTMPEAIENVFRHATTDVQAKITRVVDVWKQRSIFTQDVLKQINDRIATKAQPAKPTSSSNSLPSELELVAAGYHKLLGASSSSSLALGTANSLYSGLLDGDSSSRPSPDLYAAKLRQLAASLRSAHATVQVSVNLRTELVAQLETLLKLNSDALQGELSVMEDVDHKQDITTIALKETEDEVRANKQQSARSTTPDMDAPVAEALTPPETFEMPDVPEPIAPPEEVADNDPVARLQMELDPSITELLARQAANHTSNGDHNQNDQNDDYVP